MTKKITLAASAQPFAPGVQALAADLGLELAADGVAVEYRSADGLLVRFDGSRAEIACREKIHFFRLLAILADKLQAGPFEVRETAHFEKSGAMFDCSRNAVLTVEAFRGFLRRMAAMGLNLAMLYTEDTYTIPGRPYFGYLRGRYSAEELKALDDYADLFGIEMIPCIQTLAHLEMYLRWSAAGELADTPNVLLCGDEKVHAFLEQSITAASAPFRSRRIHLGMDEAWGIGSGRYLQKNGYRPTIDILREHMAVVADICRSRGLEPMIWSDMCLRPLSPTDEYYDFSENVRPVTKELADAVPPELNLIYWDYYHHTKEEYLTMIARHQQYGNRLVFAGGSWNWSGPVPDYGKTFDTSEKALAACRETGIREVFCTIWGDNGAESSLTNSLLGLQYYAENTYTEAPTLPQVFDAFRRCCGGCAADFYDLRLLEELPGVPEGNPNAANTTKQILYQDVLMGQFDRHLAVQRDTYGSVKEWYRARQAALAEAERRSPRYAANFHLYRVMADLLAEKAEVGLDIHAAYAAGDKAAMRQQIAVLEGLLPQYDALVLAWEDVWLATNKPFGFDVISTRLGGARGRVAYAAHRLGDWVEGKTDTLPELEEEQLFFDGRTEPLQNGTPLICVNNWARIACACPL